MNKQPEAMQLADVIEFMRDMQRSEREAWRYADELEQERNRLHEVNQELLEALNRMVCNFNWGDMNDGEHKAINHARSVIAKATGEQA